MSNVTPIHTQTLQIIRSQLASADARECRLVIEISKLHEAIGFMRAACEDAVKHCCHPGSIQARALEAAIEKAKETL